MPFYYKIKGDTEEGKRTARGLLKLRDALAVEVPRRTLTDTLLLATWNIREFDSAAYGVRLDESFYYIAEIVSHFDLIAVQEIREDLTALKRLMRILGSNWDFVVSDVTEGKPGNRERLGFIYDTSKVRFSGLAGEMVIPPKVVKTAEGKKRYEPSDQLYRTPFSVGFTAGWFKFLLTTVHVVYGEGVADDPKRVREIGMIAQFLEKRSTDGSSWSPNIIALGDFNIFSPSDVTMEQLTKSGFVVPQALQEVPATNVGVKKRHYDQIAFRLKEHRLAFGNAGVFDFYQHVFTDEERDTYAKDMGPAYKTSSSGKTRTEAGRKTYYRTHWRTHQMSDHLLMWVELGVDFGEEYLQKKGGVQPDGQ